MSSVKYADNRYSFRARTSLIGEYIERVPDAATLAQIESDLSDAATAYYQRRYNDAIDYYKKAGLLIYGYLDPLVSTKSPGAYDSVSLDARLFDPLLSVASVFMNVLPIPAPPPVRPGLAVDPTVLGNPAIAQTGIRSTTLNSRMAMSAIADMQAASHFRDLGQAAISQALETRARQTDANTAALFKAPIEGSQGATVPSSKAGAGNKMTNTMKMAVTTDVLPANLASRVLEGRTLGIMSNGKVTQISWTAGQTPDINKMTSAVYDSRITASSVLDDLLLHPQQPSDVALSLPHDYFYTIPLGIAEALHALGDYANAQTCYLQAAAYKYLNSTVEAPYLWVRLATLYADWGDSLFRKDQAADAVPIYQNVIMLDDTVPASKLYMTPSLKPGADAARNVITHLDNPFSQGVNPSFIGAIFAVRKQLIKIKGSLDFWGQRVNTVPIWTFDYLQSVAVNFAQLAINAEQEVINFWDRADQAGLTRVQITANLNQANAEVHAASLVVAQANAEVQIYVDGVATAQLRLNNVNAAKADYANKSASWILYQALSQQEAGGDNGDPNLLNTLADIYMAGQTTSSSYASWAAAHQLASARQNRAYEIDSMARTVTEMQSALKQANDELVAAKARVAAANAAVIVAQTKAQGAQEMLDYFDSQTFTPDVWHQLGDAMMRLYQRYLNMALQVARFMQKAYNFETDQNIMLIKSDYSTDTVKGLLGADALMADIQTITYELITTRAGKPQPIRQTISLSSRYGFAFETQLRKTGIMDFETRIEDFDEKYPGTYAGRIDAVEVEIDGIVPAAGVSGALTNCGISVYRLPSASWAAGAGFKYRIQPKETLILSDYAVRNDALLIQNDQRLLKLFQGAGVSSSWRLELPRSINDIDYGALTDVKITFYYKARYDPDLRDRVLQQLATHAGSNGRQRGLPLRWIYPDAFFEFMSTGALKFTLRKRDFPLNETGPVLTNLGLLFTGSGLPPLIVGLSTPGRAAVKVQTDATGVAQSDDAPAWAPLLGGTVIGDYKISLTAADNPALVSAGALALKPIVNVAIILGYTFTPRN